MSVPMNSSDTSGARPKNNASSKQHSKNVTSSDQRNVYTDSRSYRSGNLDILIHQGSITESQSCAIVTSESVFLKSRTPLAVSIAEAAGKTYRNELAELARKHPKNKPGSIFCLPASSDKQWTFVIIVIAPVWMKVSVQAWRQQMKNIIEDVLQKASDLRLKSVAFPLIGSGRRKAPLEDVSDIFCETLKSTRFPLQAVEIFVTDAITYSTVCGCFDSSMSLSNAHKKSANTKKKKVPTDSPSHCQGNVLLPMDDNDNDESTSHSISDEEAASYEGEKVMRRLSVQDDEDNCPICMDNIAKSQRKELACKHVFCKECIEEWFKRARKACPTCNKPCGIITGNQPAGDMRVQHRDDIHLPGYDDHGCIVIEYGINCGVQEDSHPNPGVPFGGASRIAYLPDTKKGRKVLKLLKVAFDRKLVFTVGTSTTTGRQNVVTWNDIHHKTRIHGGPEQYGYPDPSYLSRVMEELAVKGVTLDAD